MNGNPLDLLFIIIVVVFAILGAARGFVKEIFGKAAFIVSLLAAVFLRNYVAGFFSNSIKNALIANIVAFLIVFVVVFLVIKILQEIFSKIFSGSILKSLDHSLGFLFGIVEGVAIVAFIIMVIIIQPWFDSEAIFAGSLFYGMFGGVLSGTVKSINIISA